MNSGRYLTHAEDPRIPHGVRIRKLTKGGISYKRWFLPITWGHLTLREAYDYLGVVGAPQGKIPEVIRWTEGKDSHLVKQFFYGGVDLRAHDYIHILLGRGLLPKDEAFVIGFTMGTTNRLDSMNEDAFAYIAKHYYPNAYRMDDEARSVFLDATKLGFIADCPPLDSVDFTPYLDLTVTEVRKRLNLCTGLIQSYYAEVEQPRFPEDPASLRLLGSGAHDEPFVEHTATDSFRSSAIQADRKLDETDIAFALDEAQFESSLEAAHKEICTHLEDQRDLAKLCFEEIAKLLEDEDEHANQDIIDERWNDFYQTALENVAKSKKLVDRDVRHAKWEGYAHETSELRTWVHALLGRGNSARDRAFCRGFFHGTSNRRTTYATELKMNLMQELQLSCDGRYTDDMIQVYHDAARLGYIADCSNLAEVDFESLADYSLTKARKALKIPMKLLQTYRAEVEDRRLYL